MLKLVKIGGVPIQQADRESGFFYEAGMSINADGAPNAYHPADTGIDFLANAGSPGNWWAIVVNKDGNPFIQGSTDPYPGYYISTTALSDSGFVQQDPRRYVDSTKIPYIVLPGNNDFKKVTGVKLGDFAVVYNSNNEKLAFAIYADIGPKNQIGEGSIALSQALGNDPLVRSRVRRGIPKDIVYVVFTGSGNGQPRITSDIEAETKRLFEIWGGIERIKSL
nr:glycoside hydrolase family 75 protein [Nostoc flagelliforme]